MYACVHAVYAHNYTHVHSLTRPYAQARTHKHVRTSAYAQARTRKHKHSARTRARAHTHNKWIDERMSATQMNKRTHARMYAHVHTSMHTCAEAPLCTHAHARTNKYLAFCVPAPSRWLNARWEGPREEPMRDTVLREWVLFAKARMRDYASNRLGWSDWAGKGV